MTVLPELWQKRYPKIIKATLEIAYDNSGINRNRSEEDVLNDLKTYLFIGDLSETDLCERFLETLSDEDLVIVCTGEESEQDAILARGPSMLDGLLVGIFNEVI